MCGGIDYIYIFHPRPHRPHIDNVVVEEEESNINLELGEEGSNRNVVVVDEGRKQ